MRINVFVCPPCHRKEAKLLYRKSLKIFCGATAAAAILRALLKVLYIDLETGFYIGGGILIYLLPVVIIPDVSFRISH